MKLITSAAAVAATLVVVPAFAADLSMPAKAPSVVLSPWGITFGAG